MKLINAAWVDCRRGWIGIEVALDDDLGVYGSDRYCAVPCSPVQSGLLFVSSSFQPSVACIDTAVVVLPHCLYLCLCLCLSLCLCDGEPEGMPISQVEDDGAMDIMGKGGRGETLILAGSMADLARLGSD